MVAKNQEIYISIEPAEYRRQKSLVLGSQMDILNSIKHIQSIQKIKAEKAKMKILLKNLADSIGEDIDNLRAKLPKVKELKQKQEKAPKQEKTKEKIIIEQKELHAISNRKRTIDDELRELQNKIKMLNS